MNLPESFQSYGTTVLAKNKEIIHSWSTETGFCSLTIPSSSSSEFDIEFEVEQDSITLNWGNWHTRFEPEANFEEFIEDQFGLLRDMLSPDMRIRELYAGAYPYRGFLESFDGVTWTAEHVMGMIFWNYIGKRSERTYSNSTLPARMSTANEGVGPDQRWGG